MALSAFTCSPSSWGGPHYAMGKIMSWEKGDKWEQKGYEGRERSKWFHGEHEQTLSYFPVSVSTHDSGGLSLCEDIGVAWLPET